jgi:hypothetical protein
VANERSEPGDGGKQDSDNRLHGGNGQWEGRGGE